MFAILDGRKNGVVHDFNQDAVLAKDLTFLQAKDDDSGVFNRMESCLKETFNGL